MSPAAKRLVFGKSVASTMIAGPSEVLVHCSTASGNAGWTPPNLLAQSLA